MTVQVIDLLPFLNLHAFSFWFLMFNFIYFSLLSLRQICIFIKNWMSHQVFEPKIYVAYELYLKKEQEVQFLMTM